MATLTGNAINTSYQGLIKFDDNGVVNPTVLKQLTDGTGGSLPIQVSQIETKFQSLVDFTSATVTGLPASGNLINGVGADSLKNADSLVTSAALADGAQAIALGNGATAYGDQSISIGNGAQSTNNQGIAIGNFAESTSIGTAAIGEYASASGLYASAWGRTANAAADGAVAFGQQTNVPFTAPGGVALGRQVEADLADTTHVRALKIVAPDGGTGGNGITMLSPDGTAGVITLTNASELAIDGTPIGGGGGAAGLVAGTGANSMKSADSLTTNPATVVGAGSIAIGNGANITDELDAIAIGTAAVVEGNYGIAIGKEAETGFFNYSIALGWQAQAQRLDSVAIGKLAGVTADTTGVAIGTDTSVTADNAVALGAGVTAATANTATVKLLQIANYATMNFADDTAAATGGISLGGVYHTDGALKIRIA